jgi:hypothetical protein
MGSAPPAALRCAELLAALSLALDLGLGQLIEHFLRTCLLAVRLGQHMGGSTEDLHDIYYLALIQHLGCTAYADDTAALFGDDLIANAWLIRTDQGQPLEILRAVLQHVGTTEPLLQRSCQFLHVMLRLPSSSEVASGPCEDGQRLAERIRLGGRIQVALGQIYTCNEWFKCSVEFRTVLASYIIQRTVSLSPIVTSRFIVLSVLVQPWLRYCA